MRAHTCGQGKLRCILSIRGCLHWSSHPSSRLLATSFSLLSISHLTHSHLYLCPLSISNCVSVSFLSPSLFVLPLSSSAQTGRGRSAENVQNTGRKRHSPAMTSLLARKKVSLQAMAQPSASAVRSRFTHVQTALGNPFGQAKCLVTSLLKPSSIHSV